MYVYEVAKYLGFCFRTKKNKAEQYPLAASADGNWPPRQLAHYSRRWRTSALRLAQTLATTEVIRVNQTGISVKAPNS